MKKFILILIFTFNIQSWTKADDIKDFEIEGMSIGDSLLKYLSKEEIENKINEPTSFKYKNEKYVQIGIYKKSFETYDLVGVTIKPNDEDFIIYVISGQFNFGDDIKGCYSKQNIISKDIDELIGENAKKYEWNGDYKYDYSGKSKVKYVDYGFKDSSAIRVICYDMSKDFEDPNDALYVVVNSAEFSKFLNTL